MQAFTPNPNLLQEPSSNNGYINTTGEYLGKFTAVYQCISKQGTQGINFVFVDDKGAKAPTFTIWTHNQDGSPIGVKSKFKKDIFYPGLSFINDVAIIKKLTKTVQAVQGVANIYDYDLQQDVDKTVMIYPDLLGDIGVVITAEVYNGKQYLRLSKVFDKTTRQTAYEVFNNQQAQGVQKYVDNLNAKGWVKQEKLTTPKNPNASPDPTAPTDTPDFDDDLPF